MSAVRPGNPAQTIADRVNRSATHRPGAFPRLLLAPVHSIPQEHM
jgi:hypothetical protein